MNNPKVSVIIPAYNGAKYLGEAIQSVLDQTYSNLEIIVVDDASPERVADVVDKFTDARVRYIRHEINRGAVAARQTGVETSSSEIIAFLDQDDLFHKQKLQQHVAFLQKHPEYGLSYNSRFEIMSSVETICGLWRPPQVITLKDWVLGFPISPSDTVLRREWAMRDEIWDDSFASQAEHVIFNGQEIVFGGRLALAGCQSGNVGRALNYRRYHPRRVLKHLEARCNAELACQEIIFSDPRCPEGIRALRNTAAANIYVMWAFCAYLQEEFMLGQDFMRQAVELNPSLLQGKPCKLIHAWVACVAMGTSDYVRGHETILRSIFENLPLELQQSKEQYDWAIARSYLLKGMHTMIWGQIEDARSCLVQAAQKGAAVDDPSARMFIAKLLDYEAEFGSAASQRVIKNLVRHLQKSDQQDGVRLIKGLYAVNRAFRSYHAGEYALVPREVVNTVATDPRYLTNKGVLSILARSIAWRMGLYGKESSERGNGIDR